MDNANRYRPDGLPDAPRLRRIEMIAAEAAAAHPMMLRAVLAALKTWPAVGLIIQEAEPGAVASLRSRDREGVVGAEKIFPIPGCSEKSSTASWAFGKVSIAYHSPCGRAGHAISHPRPGDHRTAHCRRYDHESQTQKEFATCAAALRRWRRAGVTTK
jgi:hypothetical protein